MSDKNIKSSDQISGSTLHEILLNMDARLKHIEDMEADNRAVIVKLVKQSNQIVKFLQQLEVESVDPDEFEDLSSPYLSEEELEKINKHKKLQALIDEFLEKREELADFEEELKKHKDMLTPGTVGES